jgi:leucyl-tRNA synthetase
MVDGTLGFFRSIWKLVGDYIKNSDKKPANIDENQLNKWQKEIYQNRNSFLSMITYNLNGNFNIPSYIVFISKLAKFIHRTPKELQQSDEYQKLLVELLIVVSPAIPHFANECWNALKDSLTIKTYDKTKYITDQTWPLIDSSFELPILFRVSLFF